MRKITRATTIIAVLSLLVATPAAVAALARDRGEEDVGGTPTASGGVVDRSDAERGAETETGIGDGRARDMGTGSASAGTGGASMGTGSGGIREAGTGSGRDAGLPLGTALPLDSGRPPNDGPTRISAPVESRHGAPAQTGRAPASTTTADGASGEAAATAPDPSVWAPLP